MTKDNIFWIVIRNTKKRDVYFSIELFNVMLELFLLCTYITLYRKKYNLKEAPPNTGCLYCAEWCLYFRVIFLDWKEDKARMLLKSLSKGLLNDSKEEKYLRAFSQVTIVLNVIFFRF